MKLSNQANATSEQLFIFAPTLFFPPPFFGGKGDCSKKYNIDKKPLRFLFFFFSLIASQFLLQILDQGHIGDLEMYNCVI